MTQGGAYGRIRAVRRKAGLGAATQTADGVVPPYAEGRFFPPPQKGGGGAMVTYGELFTYTLVLIGIVGLCVQIAHLRNKKK